MPIAVGVLCSTKSGSSGVYPNTIVLTAAPSRKEDEDHWAYHHKFLFYPNEKVFGVCIGRTETMASLVEVVQKAFQGLADRNREMLTENVNKIVFDYRRQRFLADVLSNYRFVSGDIPEEYNAELLDSWQNYDIGAQIILGTFDKESNALMYVIGQVEGLRGWVHQVAFPGFATIGHGSHSANFWLSHRRQIIGRSVRRSAYHAYEAMRVALTDNGSAGDVEIILATSDKAIHLTKDVPENKGCPVSLKELEETYAKYGPHDTSELS